MCGATAQPHWVGANLEAFGDDAGLVALGPRQVLVQGVDEPGPEVQGIALLLYGEAFVAAAHDSLHELVGTDLCTKRLPYGFRS